MLDRRLTPNQLKGIGKHSSSKNHTMSGETFAA
jgi:hypothetical protein